MTRFQLIGCVILFLGCALSSCDSPAQKPSSAADVGVADSLNLNTAALSVLPDTMFESAKKLHFLIDTFDRKTPGFLKNLSDKYADAPGIFTFRGSPSRNPSFIGHVAGRPSKVSVDWAFSTKVDTTHTEYGVWGGGTGWTGQPLFVDWPDSLVQRLRGNAMLSDNAFSGKEIMVASLCGMEYFIDFETGRPSRKPIDLGNVIKGTPSIDPSLNGLLFVGQGVPRQEPFGALMIDLYTGNRVDFFPEDKKAWRGWGAYDSSPVVVDDFMFRPGENGTVYKYVFKDKRYVLHSTLRYSATGKAKSPGIESSMAVYHNYGYFGDNSGGILCINLNTLKPVWFYDDKDDTDASVVVVEENGHPYAYTGTEVDKLAAAMQSRFVKLDALTGELVWEQTVSCKKMFEDEKHFDGGLYGTPLIGIADCDSLIFGNFCINDSGGSGDFIAFSRATGNIVYRTHLKHYAWSSPVAFTNDGGEMFVFTGDTNGNVYLIQGKTGEILFCEHIGGNFESSPIVIGNKVVLGSRGNKIYKMTVE